MSAIGYASRMGVINPGSPQPGLALLVLSPSSSPPPSPRKTGETTRARPGHGGLFHSKWNRLLSNAVESCPCSRAVIAVSDLTGYDTGGLGFVLRTCELR
jgi:hypothetical protein